MSLYEAERIIGKRINPQTKRCEYKVKWQGFSVKQCTWEPKKNLKFVRHLIEEFEKQTNSHEFSINKGKQNKKHKSKDSKNSQNVYYESERDIESQFQIYQTTKKARKYKEFPSAHKLASISQLSRHIQKRNKENKQNELRLKQEVLKKRHSLMLTQEPHQEGSWKTEGRSVKLFFQEEEYSDRTFKIIRVCLRRESRQLLFLVEENSIKKLMKRKQILQKHPFALIRFYQQRVVFTGKGSINEKSDI